MAHRHYQYLKQLLRNNLQLELDEFTLLDTPQKGLVCCFMDIQLASAFQPIVRADGKVAGREALLRAGPLSPLRAFAQAFAAERVVQFDRLVRVVHLLNHARNFDEHELLFLNVHPQLLARVSDHGRTFDNILHYYSVPASQVVIELKEAAGTDPHLLQDAVKNYRSLGYRIAVDDFGSEHSNLLRVLALKPDIVKLDGALIARAAHDTGGFEKFELLVARLQKAGCQVAVQGIETNRQLALARRSGADFLQGFVVSKPVSVGTAKHTLLRSTQLAA